MTRGIKVTKIHWGKTSDQIDKYLSTKSEHSDKLLLNIKARVPEMEELLAKLKGHWYAEDFFYRYYYGSFKVYHLQSYTLDIVKIFKELNPVPGGGLSKLFESIVGSGTGKVFEASHNDEWEKYTRPIVDAFMHARYFLELIVKYGKELEKAPNMMPSGWAAILCLFNLR